MKGVTARKAELILLTLALLFAITLFKSTVAQAQQITPNTTSQYIISNPIEYIFYSFFDEDDDFNFFRARRIAWHRWIHRYIAYVIHRIQESRCQNNKICDDLDENDDEEDDIGDSDNADNSDNDDDEEDNNCNGGEQDDEEDDEGENDEGNTTEPDLPIPNGVLHLDGDDYLSMPDHDDWAFGDRDFTIDGWAWIEPGYEGFYWNQTEGGASPRQNMGVNTTGATYWFDNPGSSRQFSFSVSWTLPECEWHHIALSRNNDDWYWFLDGGLVNTVTKDVSVPDFNADAVYGYWPDNGGRYFKGYMDESRISVGIARWTSDFVPSSSKLEPDEYTKLLLHFNNLESPDFIDSSSRGHEIKTSGNPSKVEMELVSKQEALEQNQSEFTGSSTKEDIYKDPMNQ